MTDTQAKCLEQAKSYLEKIPFSKQGLIGQLEYKGFDQADIDFALENIDVDWTENAIKKSEDYLATIPLSKPALEQQLDFDGFTKDQIAVAVEKTY